MIYEVQCNICQSVYDLPEDPMKTNWKCDCQNRPTAMRRIWNICNRDKRHHFWSNMSEDCRFCEDEKMIKQEGNRLQNQARSMILSVNGQKMELKGNDTTDRPLLNPANILDNLIQKAEQEKAEQKARELRVIELLEKLVQEKESTIRELDDK